MIFTETSMGPFLFPPIDRHRPTNCVVDAWTLGEQAFKALGSPAKEGMRANKLLREEMALQEVGGFLWFCRQSAMYYIGAPNRHGLSLE